MLGIASDQVFVFIDAWRQSAVIAPEWFETDKKKRMAYAFRRSSRAIALSASLTGISFLANAFSPFMEIRSFGIFTGLIIPVNSILLIILFPPSVILYEENKFRCCWPREIDIAEEEYEQYME